jgi:hypothetical protein
MNMHRLLIFVLALAQQQPRPTTGAATTNGPCSLANSGTVATVTFACGIGREQAKKMLEILNKIVANQLPADAVMGKLDEIARELQRKNTQGGGVNTDTNITGNQNQSATIVSDGNQISFSSLTDAQRKAKQEILGKLLLEGDEIMNALRMNGAEYASLAQAANPTFSRLATLRHCRPFQT